MIYHRCQKCGNFGMSAWSCDRCHRAETFIPLLSSGQPSIDLCSKCGTFEVDICHWENGDNEVMYETECRLCHYRKITGSGEYFVDYPDIIGGMIIGHLDEQKPIRPAWYDIVVTEEIGVLDQITC